MLMMRQIPSSHNVESSLDNDFIEWSPEPPSEQPDNAPYLPSPEEIEIQCREIRRDWSEAEYRKRSGQPYKPLVLATTPCRMSFPDFYLDNA